MTYNQYVEEIFAKRLELEWPHPYRWSLSNGLSALRSAVEAALGRSDTRSNDGKLRSGFLCRSRDSSWCWLLLKQDYDSLSEDVTKSEHLEAFRTQLIPQGRGMVGRALDTIRDPKKFKDRGGLFNTLEHSRLIQGRKPGYSADLQEGEAELSPPYSPELKKAELALWPTDEFISMILLGVATLTDRGLNLDTENDSLDELPFGGIAIVFVFTVGPEPLAPGQITDTITLISESKRFFGQFLQENSPLLRVFADALTRSAVAAVMARNMSHNIGSHVSPRATIDAIDQRLNELSGALTEAPQDDSQRLLIIRTLRKKLDEYGQKKADFLAEITTEPLTTSKTSRFFKEVILPFASNTLLLDTLCANEALRYRSVDQPSVLLRCRYKGREVFATFAESAALSLPSTCQYVYPDRLPYTLFPVLQPDEEITPKRALQVFRTQFYDGSDFEDFDVELPGPLGEFAFFALLENLFRNSAKHNRNVFSRPESPPKLEMSVDVAENSPQTYRITIYDNVTDPDSEGFDGETPLWKRIERLVRTPLIDADGQLRKSAWGIAEARICATLLSGSTDFVNAMPLSVERLLDDSGTPRLAYSFDMMKPKKICAIVRRQIGETRIEELKAAGIYVFPDVKAARAHINSAQDSAASFRFFVVDCEAANCDCMGISDFIHELPFRRIITHRTSCGKLTEMIEQRALHVAGSDPDWYSSTAELEQWCWRTWADRWLRVGDGKNEPAMEVHVYLDQELKEKQTAEWKAAGERFSRSPENSAVRLRIWGNDHTGWVPPTSEVPRLFLDRHVNLLSNVLHYAGKLLDDDKCILLDKNNSDFLKLFQPAFPEDLQFWTLPYELAEACSLRIAVIDERLAESAVRVLDEGKLRDYVYDGTRRTPMPPAPCIWHAAFAANVFISTHLHVTYRGRTFSGPLHGSSFRGREESAKQGRVAVPYFELVSDGEVSARWSADLASAPTHSMERPLDLLIIHQGILDTIERECNYSGSEFLDNLKSKIPFLVVDSGRGMPPNLSENAKFLPFSLLQDYVGDMRTSKFNLTQVLMSLARRKRRRAS